LANLATDRVFLLVKRLLLCTRYVPVIHAGHRAFFLPDGMVFLVQLLCLPFGDFTVSHFFIDTPILILQAVIYLFSARMIGGPITCEYSRR
jgi:hypothetical protein